MTKTNNSEALEGFVDKLLEEKQLPDLDPEVREQLRQDLLSRVEDRINAVLMQNLEPKQLEEFNQILEGGNTREIQGFLAKEIPDLQEVIAATLIKFRSIYLGL